MGHRRMNIRQRANGAFGRWPSAAADGRRALGQTPPATLQFIEGGIVFAPLTAGEKAPFQRVLETRILLAFSAPRDLSSRALDVQAVQNGMMPGPIIGPFANGRIELQPIVRSDGFAPDVKIRQYNPHAPRR